MENQITRDGTNKEKTLLFYARKNKADKPTPRPDEKKRVAVSTMVTCKKPKSTNPKQTEQHNGHQSKEAQVQDENVERDIADVEDTAITLPKLETRMSPSDFVTLLIELSSTQLESLATTAFKYFVHLNVTRFPSKLAHYIVNTYNDRDHQIVLTNRQCFTVNKEDVHNVLGLPMGPTLMTGDPIVSGIDYEAVFSQWIKQFGNDAKGRVVKMGVLKKYIIEHKEEAGPMFKRNIILYIVTKMIYCAGNDHVWLDIFPWLVDTDNLNQLDWCDFVIDRLMKARENWSDGASFRGPLLFLVLHYVDTVVDGREDTRRDYPRLKSWTTQKLNNREKKGIKRGDFGGGFVRKDGLPKNELGTTTKNEEPIEEDPVDEMTALLHDYAQTMMNLASMYKQFDMKGRKLFEKHVNHEDIKRVVVESRKVFNLAALPSTSHTSHSASEKNDHNESVAVKEKADNNDIFPSFSQDPFFDSPEIWELVDSTTRAKESSIQPNDIVPPSFSLGLTQEFATLLDKETNENEKENGEEQPSLSASLNQQTHEDEEENRQEAEVQQEGEGSKAFKTNEGEGSKAEKKEKTPINRENRLPGKEFRSPYVVRCLNAKSVPTKKESDFAAYLQSIDKKQITCMFKSGSVITTSKDLCSLVTRGSFVEANVISTYAYILSSRERLKDPSSPSRMFFPIEVTTKLVGFDDYEKSYNAFKGDMDSYFTEWSIFENPPKVDLFFFPFFMDRHFFVACFNVKSGKQRYDFLDNKSEGGSSLDKFLDLPSKLQEFFARWLLSKNLPNKASLVRSLTVERPEMKWRDQSNDCDCAVYTMRHMETYKGDLKDWDTGLEKGQFKTLQNLRVKYAYDIVNSKNNGMRAEVLSHATRGICAKMKP